MDVNCNNLFGFLSFKLMLMYWCSPFFNKSQWSIPVKGSWDRGGGEKQNKNVTRSIKQLVLANICCSRGKGNKGQELSPQGFTTVIPLIWLYCLSQLWGQCSGQQRKTGALEGGAAVYRNSAELVWSEQWDEGSGAGILCQNSCCEQASIFQMGLDTEIWSKVGQ